MKALSFGLFFIVVALSGCRETETKILDDKQRIAASTVSSVTITQLIRSSDTLKSFEKYLNREQIKSFVDKWNDADEKNLIKYLPTFNIEVNFKNNTTRKFRVNGQHIKESNDWSYDVKDKDYFVKLFSEASVQE